MDLEKIKVAQAGALAALKAALPAGDLKAQKKFAIRRQ
jgi:hypothetical protein